MSATTNAEYILLTVGVIAAAGVIFLSYNDLRPLVAGTSTGVGDAIESVGEVVNTAGQITERAEDVVGNVVDEIGKLGMTIGIGTTSNTVGEGSPCHSNADCSITGVAGGPNARLSDQYGCCAGVCKRKYPDAANRFWCDQPSKTLETGKPCSLDRECSKTGVAGGPPADFFDKSGCCGGTCKVKVPGFLGIDACPA